MSNQELTAALVKLIEALDMLKADVVELLQSAKGRPDDSQAS